MPNDKTRNNDEASQATAAQGNSAMNRWTKRLFAIAMLLFGLLFAVQGFGLFSVPDNSEFPDRLQVGGLTCNDAVWQFGTVDSATFPKIVHVFTLINETDKKVEIIEVGSTCGCMIAGGYENELAPGESTDIEATISLPPMPGYFNKVLSVFIGGEKPSMMPLVVRGDIAPNDSMFTIPGKLNFGTVKKGETSERTLQVIRHSLGPIRFSDVNGNGMAAEQVSGEEHRADLHVVFNSQDIPAGPYIGSLEVQTDHEQYPKCQVPIFVMVEE